MMRTHFNLLSLFLILALASAGALQAQTTASGWYTEGDDNIPGERISFTVTNPLDIPMKNQPVVIHREDLPVQNIPKRWINVVDPNLPSRDDPTIGELTEYGGYLYRRETNGRSIAQQIDDVNKDGVWDEIFFLTDLEPNETRRFYLYIGPYERGLYEHRTHAAIGNYGRMTVPFWESEVMGWKLWYPHDVDLHGKIEPMLTAYPEYTTNRSGYYMDWELGTDIMQVRSSFGAGGMALFEDPDDPEHPSRAFYSPYKDQGPYKDSRFTYYVDFNGPLRSRITVRTMNWNTEHGGFYELRQRYTAVADKVWSTVSVEFDTFLPPHDRVRYGAGIRVLGTEGPEEHRAVVGDGYVISLVEDIEARIPDEDIGDEALVVPWQGSALAVRSKYDPEYVRIDNYLGNHLFMMPVNEMNAFEYKIFGAWSYAEGTVNNEADFLEYVEQETLKYNHPPVVEILEHEKRP